MKPSQLFAAIGTACMAASIAACSNHSSNSTTRSEQEPQATSSAQAPPAERQHTIVEAGTYFYGKLDRSIGTKKNKNGDGFTLVETTSRPFSLAGSEIDGHLANVRPAGAARSAEMTLVFDDIRTFDGTTAPVNVELLSAEALSPKTPQADIALPARTVLEVRFKSPVRATVSQ
jgi:hypothetical protein